MKRTYVDLIAITPPPRACLCVAELHEDGQHRLYLGKTTKNPRCPKHGRRKKS